MAIESGFLLVNKPKDISSFSCVAHIKRLLPKKTKVGHAGTLDPFAHGLLIVGIGRAATSKLGALMQSDKVYVATGKLGERTDTLDRTGIVTQAIDTMVTQRQLQEAVLSMVGQYIQTPPLYSALKHQGMPLYALARNQVMDDEQLHHIAASKKRAVTIHALELLEVSFPYFTIRAHVSHGTYIRSLLDDIAQKVGSCATTYELERTSIGPWRLQEAHSLVAIADREWLKEYMFPGI